MAARKRTKKQRRRKATGRKTRRKKAGGSKPTRAPALPSGYRLPDAEVERLLQAGGRQGLLEEYFGESGYQELVDLSRQAAGAAVRGGPRVLVLPGLLGSRLGRRRKLLPDDVLWIDPLDVVRGRLAKLTLPGSGAIEPLGVLLLAYLKLKLRLRIAGFDADFHPYDWRRGIDELGRELMERIQQDPAHQVHVVAHSMGGLVTRAGLAAAPAAAAKLGRFVMLGTPNFGSFVPVQVLRGTYPVLSAVALLDVKHDPEELSRKLFFTLPSLHQMLPSPQRFGTLDLYDPGVWPADRPGPNPALLSKAVKTQDAWAAADERFHLIAGVDQPTTVGIVVHDGSFDYEESREGDGTVPLALARLPGAKTWYVEEAHGSLANNSSVGQAVVDILSTGTTARLATRWESRRARTRRVVRAEELARPPVEARSAAELSPRDRRYLLAPLVAPDSHERPAPAGARDAAGPGEGYGHALESVVVARRRQHTLDLRLALGSITEADTRALVLGLFRNVEPAGPAGAIDELLGGAIKEFTTRRMFSGEVGEVFMMPTGRSRIYADSVLFVGLGLFDGFAPEVHEFVAENVVRSLVRTHVEDFATVLMGAGSGKSVKSALYHQLRGFIRGLLEADEDHRLHRVTLCERDADRYLEIKEELLRLTSTPLFEGVRVTLDEVSLPEAPLAPAPVARGRVRERTDLVYLIVSQLEDDETRPGARASRAHVTFRSSLLTSGSKATVLTGSQRVARRQIDELMRGVQSDRLSERRLAELGDELGRSLLDPDVARALLAMRGNHLVVIHDAPGSRLPWEILHVDGWAPAAERGMSRRYSAEDLSVAKWLETRRIGEVLDLLLVVDPTEDLPGAEEEGRRLERLFPADSALKLTRISRGDATRRTLLREFGSGAYDAIHYAGHAHFDAEEPSRSGIFCAGEEVLSGRDLAGLSRLPALVFFNACESARLRGRSGLRERIQTNVGLAEAFLRGGVANYVGTYWPVGDEAALTFSRTFYRKLVSGAAIGAALQAGRDAVRAEGSVDWADYIHYGSYDFALKRLGREPEAPE